MLGNCLKATVRSPSLASGLVTSLTAPWEARRLSSLGVRSPCHESFRGKKKLHLKDTSHIGRADFRALLEASVFGDRGAWVDSTFSVSGILRCDGDVAG